MSFSEKNIDQQSSFTQDQSELLPPPEAKPKPKSPGGNKKLVVIGAILLVTIVSLVLILTQPTRTPIQETPPEPTPIPTAEPSRLQQSLNSIDLLIELTNQEQELFLPPPVDMKITL